MAGYFHNKQVRITIAVVMLAASGLACRPVVTVGWGEMLLLGLVIILILGPLLLRIFRRLGRNLGQEEGGEDQ